jgi:hypothetical protein
MAELERQFSDLLLEHLCKNNPKFYINFSILNECQSIFQIQINKTKKLKSSSGHNNKMTENIDKEIPKSYRIKFMYVLFQILKNSYKVSTDSDYWTQYWGLVKEFY